MRVFFAAVLLAGAAIQTGPFRLEWEHSGASVSEFQLCVDGTCSTLDATRRGGSDTWSAPLPGLPQGFHTLIVAACNGTVCTPGAPALSVNVQPTGPDVVTPPPTPTPPAPGTKAPPRHPPRK